MDWLVRARPLGGVENEVGGVLDDPKRAFPPYDAVLLLSPKAAKNNDLVNVLEPLVNQISVSAMRFANGLVDEKGISPKEAAQTLLSDE